jgi:hypothetical protein
MHVVTLHYSERLIRRAVMAFVWRSLGREAIVSVGMAAAVVVLWLHGVRGWGFGFVSGVVAVAVLLSPVVFVVHYRQSTGRLRTLRSPQSTLSWNEREFTLASDLGSSTLLWSTVQSVWRFDEFWLLLFSRAQFVTLPLASLDEATRAQIVGTVAKVN